jgi:hypothetical protein
LLTQINVGKTTACSAGSHSMNLLAGSVAVDRASGMVTPRGAFGAMNDEA